MKKNINRDRCCIVSLVLLVSIVASLSLIPGSFWGDDYAAYISDGIAMAEGSYGEKITLNPLMHPTNLPENKDEVAELVYVRGVPLLYALIYRLAGFEPDGSNLIWYKLPNVIFLSLCAVVFYFFLRRKEYSPLFSFLLALIFSLHKETLSLVDNCETDIFFCFFSLLSVLLTEEYVKTPPGSRKTALAIGLGFSLWFGLEIRLNGTTLVFLFLYASLRHFFRKGRKLPDRSFFLPLAIPLIGKTLLNCFLPAPTSNLSDFGLSDLGTVVDNCIAYFDMSCHWFGRIFWVNSSTVPPFFCWIIPRFFEYIGFCKVTLSEENSTVVFAFGTMVVLIALPYTQGYRYFLNVLPYFLYFSAEGWSIIAEKLFCHVRWKPFFASVLSVAIVFGTASSLLGFAEKRRNYASDSRNAFNADAVDMYSYIRRELPEDSVVYFFKPRLLYLTTHRLGCAQTAERYWDNNPADYFLSCPVFGSCLGSAVYEEEPLYANETMALYRIKR